MAYRLHLDIPLGDDQGYAIKAANHIAAILRDTDWGDLPDKESMQIRLGNDEDRSKKDFLRINSNGHAANGKQSLFK